MSELRAELLSDAALGSLPVSGFTRGTQRYVPGSVLRGAVASQYLAAGYPLDSTFISAFEGRVRWGALYLRGEPPQPLSWWVHKYQPSTQCPKSYDDAADAVPSDHRCAECQMPLEPSKGALRGVGTKVDTHVKLVHGTASKGDLFARERVAHRGSGGNLAFVGRVDPLDDVGADALQQVWEVVTGESGESAVVWFGGRRSTNGGRARLTRRESTVPALTPIDGTLTIRLTSPGLFVDDYGRPCGSPRLDEVSDVLRVPVTIDRAWRRWTSEGGWHAASKLPKPVERAVAAGSVFRLGLGGVPSQEALQRLAIRGLGLRKAEGFGSISAMPTQPPNRKQMLNDVICLRSLPEKTRKALLRELEMARTSSQSGQDPTWKLVATLTNPPPSLRKAEPSNWKPWADACRQLMSVRDPETLHTMIDHIRSNR